MKIRTKALGEVVIDDDNIITFVGRGILGFEGLSKFIILKHTDDSPFRWLQSLEEPGLAFVVIPPEEFKYNYRLEISETDLEELQLENPSDAISLSIVVILDDPNEMTANLQGPIIINPEKKLALQAVSLVPGYTTRHYILKEMEELAGKLQQDGESAGVD